MAERRWHFSGWTACLFRTNAKNKEGALKLINFLLRPDVAKEVAETIGYPTPNLAARKLLSPEVANDKTLYPDAENHQQRGMAKRCRFRQRYL